MDKGRRRLERALGRSTYRSVVAQLRKEHYTDRDHLELAQILHLRDYYDQLKQMESVKCNEYSNLLLTRWAMENPSRVTKRNLSRIFKRTENLKNIAELVDYVFFPCLESTSIFLLFACQIWFIDRWEGYPSQIVLSYICIGKLVIPLSQ